MRLTPVSAFHKLDRGPCACLFESVIGGEKVGRYSFLAADPFLQIEARGQRDDDRHAAGDRDVHVGRSAGGAEAAGRGASAGQLPELPPFTSGAVGYAGYDVVRYSEQLPNAPRRRPPAARPGVRVLRPHGRLRPCQQDDRRGGDGPAGRDADPAAAYADACRRVDELVAQLAAPAPICRRPTSTRAASRRSLTRRISRRPTSSRPSKSASNTSAPATSFRS